MTRLKVYGAPWCPDCRRTKTFLGEHRVPYEWIDVDTDADGLRVVEELQNGGRTIPTVVFADGTVLLEPSDEELARALGVQVTPQQRCYDLAVVGGGPAGLAAAIYAAREGIETIVIERSALGGQAGLTSRIDNYPGFPEGIGGAELVDRFVQHAGKEGVELLGAVGARSLRRCENGDLEIALSTGETVIAHAAIIATGSRYRRLGVAGEDDLVGSAVHFCATCDGPFYRGAKELLVVGGGNSGFEEALFLSQFATRVRLIDRNPRFKASPLIQEKVAANPAIRALPHREIAALQGNGRLDGVVVRDLMTGHEETWTPDGIFVFIGLTPNTGFLNECVALDAWGFIDTGGSFETSLPGVFAAGDVRSGSTKQLGVAIGEGITALLHVRQYLRAHSHVSATPVNA